MISLFIQSSEITCTLVDMINVKLQEKELLIHKTIKSVEIISAKLTF